MSRERLARRADAGRTDAGPAAGRWSLPARDTRATLPAAALAAVLARTGFGALHNAPVELPGAVVGLAPELGAAAGLLSGVAAVALGLRSDHSTERVGLLFVGVFGALATVVPAATVPATVALVGGGALALSGLEHREGWYENLRRAVPVALVVAVGLALGPATGLLPPGTRATGSALAAAALAASPLLVRPGTGGWMLGALAAGGVVWAGSALPFVVGAVTLVAFGLVGTPLLLFAAGVGGCVATVTGALGRRQGRERGDAPVALGAALVLLAGAPSTVPAATAVLLGAALLAGAGPGGDRP